MGRPDHPDDRKQTPGPAGLEGASVRLPRLGLRGRLVLLGLLASLVTALLVGMVGFRATENAAKGGTRALLSAEARLNAERVLAPLDAMRSETEVFSRLPIIRLMNPKAQTAPDRQADLHRRLGLVFATLLSERPAYFQARLITLADGGREVVRIDFGPEGAVTIPAEALQRKGAEPYMRPLMQGTVDHGYFSAVTLNREHGRVQRNAPVTLRYVQPVRDEAGRIYGAIVLNADLTRLLGSVTPHLSPDHLLHVITDSGDHITLGADGPVTALRFHGDPDFQPFDWPGAGLALPPDGARFDAGEVVTHAFAHLLPGADGPAPLTTVVSVPLDSLMAPVHALARSVLLFSALAGALALTFSFAVWRLTMRPIKALLALTGEALARHAPGKPAAMASTGDEILDLKGSLVAALDNLSDASGRARAMFLGSADGVMMVRRDGTITEINPSALAMFGYAAGETVTLEMLVPPESRSTHRALVRDADVGPQGRRMAATRPIRGVRADGSTFPIEISISPVDFHGDTQFVAMIRDISLRAGIEAEREALIDDLGRAKADLERSNEELNSFAYVASHDLKAPLRVIDNASRWLEEDIGDTLEEDSRENITLIRSRVSRMERLLDDLLLHSRIGRDDRVHAAVDGAELMAAIRDLIDLPEGFRVEADESLAAISLPRMPIQSVLLNLVSNAIKHHDRPDGTVRVSVTETDAAYVFTVADDGPGIAAEYHDRIFGMFTTLRPRDQVEGSGMGLAMVRKTVGMVGGSVALDSAPGAGSRFIVTWPRPAARSGSGTAHPDKAA